jgi:hypothetical protein
LTIDWFSPPPGNFSVMQLALESPVVIVPLVAVLATGAVPLLVPAGGGLEEALLPEVPSDFAVAGLPVFNGSCTTAVELGICEIVVESSPELAELAARLGISTVFAVTVPVSGDAYSLLPVWVTTTVSAAIANTAKMPTKACHRLRPVLSPCIINVERLFSPCEGSAVVAAATRTRVDHDVVTA